MTFFAWTKEVVDIGLRRDDEFGIAEESVIRAPG
jgi:hypothetical protein